MTMRRRYGGECILYYCTVQDANGVFSVGDLGCPLVMGNGELQTRATELVRANRGQVFRAAKLVSALGGARLAWYGDFGLMMLFIGWNCRLADNSQLLECR